MACPNCGCTETASNDARGETVCTGCGMVVAESIMVDQLTFGGGGKMHGGFVDANTGNTRGFAAVYGKRESREATLAKGWHNLERVACEHNHYTHTHKHANPHWITQPLDYTVTGCSKQI